jgi:hypothetical protein
VLARGTHLLTLVIALFTGIVPMRVCSPADGSEGAVVALGVHAYDQDDEGQSERDGSDECCTDAPFPLGVPGSRVTLDAPVALAYAVSVDPSESGISEFCAVASLLPCIGVPLGTKKAVLLL